MTGVFDSDVFDSDVFDTGGSTDAPPVINLWPNPRAVITRRQSQVGSMPYTLLAPPPVDSGIRFQLWPNPLLPDTHRDKSYQGTPSVVTAPIDTSTNMFLRLWPNPILPNLFRDYSFRAASHTLYETPFVQPPLTIELWPKPKLPKPHPDRTPQGTPRLYQTDPDHMPFGMLAFMHDYRIRQRPFNRAVLTPLIHSQPFFPLKFSMTGDVDLSFGVTAKVSNLLGQSRPMRHSRVYVHSPWAPYERLAELTTAYNVDRSYTRMSPGNASLHISSSDPQISSDVLDYGNLLVIESDYMPPWVGTIYMVGESLKSPGTEIQAKDLAAILDNRITAQSEQYKKAIGSTTVALNLVNHMNFRGHTGIFPTAINETGPSITELQVGGQSVMQALDEVNTRTDYEWWLESVVTPQRITTAFNWGFQQGDDFSGDVQLFAGIHFTDLDYKLDLSQVKASLVSIGDFGAELGARNSATRTTSNSTSRAAFGTSAQDRATELAARSISDLPAGLRSERIVYDLMTGTIAELDRRAKRQLERPLAATELIGVTVNRIADWANIRVGNYITVHATPGVVDLVRRVRIVGMQPDEERGELVLVCEVPPN